MEQFHDILKCRFFTAVTSIDNFQHMLEYVNSYYLNPTGIPDDVVDSTNIRSVVSNENNQVIVKAFYSFLTSATEMNASLSYPLSSSTFSPTAKFKSIYYDDEKFAEAFNNFYNSSILSGKKANSIPPWATSPLGYPQENPDIYKNVITNQLSSFTSNEQYEYVTQTVYHNNFIWTNSPWANNPPFSPSKEKVAGGGLGIKNAVLDIYGGERNNVGEQKYIQKNISGSSYFIDVLLLKSFTQTAKMAFETCNSIIYKTINGSQIFSQNQIDLVNFQDFSKITNRSFDNYDMLSTEYIAPVASGFPISPPLSGGMPLIQCFVDPNFKTNENAIWSDNFFKISFASRSYLLIRNDVSVLESIEIPILFSNLIDGNQTFKIRATYTQGGVADAVVNELSLSSLERVFNPSSGINNFLLHVTGLINSKKATTIRLEIIDYGEFIPGTYMTTIINVVPPIIPPKKIYFNPFTQNAAGQPEPLPVEIIDGKKCVIFQVDEMPETQTDLVLPVQIIINEMPEGNEFVGLEYSQSPGSVESGTNDSSDWTVYIDSSTGQPIMGNLSNTTNVETVAWLNPGQTNADKIKNLRFHIENNVDNNPGQDEYILVKILYDSQHANTQTVEPYNDNLDYSLAKIVIKDTTVIPPSVKLCSLPDFYYLDFSDAKYDSIDESVLSYYIPGIRYRVKEEYAGNKKGPRFKEYIYGSVFDNGVSGYGSYGVYSDSVMSLSANYTKPGTANDDIFVLRDLEGSLWELAGSYVAGQPQPSFPSTDTIYSVSDVNGLLEGYSSQIFWRKRNSETENICNSTSVLMGRSEIAVSALTPGTQILLPEESVNTTINGQVETSADVQLMLTNNSGDIIVGPPARKLAAENPTVTTATVPGGSTAQIVTFSNCSYPINIPSSFGTAFNGRTKWELHDRFLVKAGVQNIQEKSLNFGSTSVKFSKVSVYYFINGLRKSWDVQGGIYDGVFFPNKIQRARRVDSNGDVWEWAYRVVSPVVSTPNILSNDTIRETLDAYYKDLNGWGWYKMMKINSENQNPQLPYHVYDSQDEMVKENTVGVLNGVDGNPNTDFPPSNCSDVIVTPNLTSVISGDISPLVNSTQTYSVDNIVGLTFTWVVPAGWVIVSGQGTNSITVTVTSNPGVVSVVPKNQDGTVAGNGSSLNVIPSAAQIVTLNVKVNHPYDPQVYEFDDQGNVLSKTPLQWVSISIDGAAAVKYKGKNVSVNVPLNSNVTINRLISNQDAKSYKGMGGDVDITAAQTSATLNMNNNKTVFVHYLEVTGNLTPTWGTNQWYRTEYIPDDVYTWSYPTNWTLIGTESAGVLLKLPASGNANNEIKVVRSGIVMKKNVTPQ